MAANSLEGYTLVINYVDLCLVLILLAGSAFLLRQTMKTHTLRRTDDPTQGRPMGWWPYYFLCIAASSLTVAAVGAADAKKHVRTGAISCQAIALAVELYMFVLAREDYDDIGAQIFFQIVCVRAPTLAWLTQN